jgi:hypothetical protein
MESQEQLIAQRKNELLMYVQSFYRRSWDWRSQKMHQKWNKVDRNYHGIYDPAKASQKEPWQSTMFNDITLQNIEIIASQLYKTSMAPKSPVAIEAGPAGDELQATLMQEIQDYEWDKAQFKLAFYDAEKEAVKYGDGFVKFYWEKVEDTRLRRVPVEQSPQEVIDNAPPEVLMGQMPMPQPSLKGFQMQPVRVLLKNQLATKYVHIRDVFPEPNTTSWDKGIHRDKITYGEIVRQIKLGAFFDERENLENVIEGDKFEQDTRDIKQERGYFETNRNLSKFEKQHTVWELCSPIPRKWIQFDIPDGDDAEELVPGKVMVASGLALLSSEENQAYDGEWMILKIPYIRTGETYDKGIGEMLFDDQDEINEHTNLGIDNMNLIINKMIGVLEAALVNSEQDLVSKPGGIIRFKAQIVDDVRKALMPIEFPDLAQSFFKHRFDIERMVQEKTGANRVTLGSSGAVKDTNQTLGGMELLRQMFNERVAAYGMVQETAFLIRAAQKTGGLVYQNLSPEDLKSILGDDPVKISDVPNPMTGQMMPLIVPRYAAFAFPPPEEVNKSYLFKPMGVFSLENKIVKAAQFMDWAKLFAPVLDMVAAAKYSAKLLGNDEADKMVMPMPLLPPPSPANAKETPGLKGGPNGNGPSFSPPNPLRREPVVA